MSLTEAIKDRNPSSQAPKCIYMWERKETAGKTHYVPLDKNMKPVAKIALEDIHKSNNNGGKQQGNFSLVSEAIRKPAAKEIDQKSQEGLIVSIVEAILREGDATTYQVYETLISRLISGNLSYLVTSEDIDVQRILQDHFWYYEFPLSLGAVAKIWTLDEEKAQCYFKLLGEVNSN